VPAVASAKTVLSKRSLTGPVHRPNPVGRGLITRLRPIPTGDDGAEIPRLEASSFVDGDDRATS